VVFAEGFLGGVDQCVDAVPFVFGVVQVELFGAERAFEGDLVGWEGLGVGSSRSDHGQESQRLKVTEKKEGREPSARAPLFLLRG
jgi:hypothetical protein